VSKPLIPHTKAIRLSGKPGYWIALDPRSNRRVGEGRTLKAAAQRADKAGVKDPVFTQIPLESCALVM
jgi:hypothetical protein